MPAAALSIAAHVDTMLSMRFTKMHGCGNAYVYVDARREQVHDPEETARRVAHHETGIGSDGLILIEPGDRAPVRMAMYNADGSRGAMCGNGLRCVGKFVLDDDPAIGRTWCAAGSVDVVRRQLREAGVDGSCSAEEAEAFAALEVSLAHALPAGAAGVGIRVLEVETDAGLKTLYGLLHGGQVVSVTADVGPITLERKPELCSLSGSEVVDRPVELAGRTYRLTCVDVGSFHAVVFVPDVDAVDLHGDGSMLETAPFFPDRANIHFVQVAAANTLRMRPWERGSGITLACGTGACAAVTAAVATGRAEPNCRVDQPGGTVWVRLGQASLLTGPAEVVCRGDWQDGQAHYDSPIAD